jgi:hypothetical protein
MTDAQPSNSTIQSKIYSSDDHDDDVEMQDAASCCQNTPYHTASSRDSHDFDSPIAPPQRCTDTVRPHKLQKVWLMACH